MGKRIIQQARGKGGPTYRAPSFRYKGRARFNKLTKDKVNGVITDLIHCPGHSSPLMEVKYDNDETCLMIAPEGVKVGDRIDSGAKAEIKLANTLPLKDIPEGTLVYNIESSPGDGGKFVRSSGVFARVVSKIGDRVVVELPSKKQKSFFSECRASIGVVSGGGRPEKPFLKAGLRYFKMKARNKLWPIVSAGAMNAVDHPYGNKRSSRKAKNRPISRNAPPGRKVGLLAARKTGRRKK